MHRETPCRLMHEDELLFIPDKYISAISSLTPSCLDEAEFKSRALSLIFLPVPNQIQLRGTV